MIPEQRGILILESSDVAWRFLVAYAFAFWSMTTISSLAFFFSSFVENAIGPIVAAGGLLIVMMVLTFLPVEALEPVKPFMFTKHMNLWQLAFGSPLDWVAIKEGVTTHGVYTVVSVCAAWLIFVRKDILS
jgi:ABC-2 type transport system permease protein